MTKSCSLTVLPDETTVEVRQGVSVLEALHQSGIQLRSDCGGIGACGKCLIFCQDGSGLSPLSTQERTVLRAEDIERGYRLACAATIISDATVIVSQSDSGNERPRGKDVNVFVCSPDPAVRRIYVGSDKLSFELDALKKGGQFLREQFSSWPGFPAENIAADVLHLLEGCPFEKGVTLVCHEHLGVLKILPGNKMTSLGLAFDMGTTTIAAYLCDLQSGEQLASAAMFNPQRKFGDDVISRISRASENEAVLKEMQSLVVAAFDQLATQCLADCGGSCEEVDELVVVGNTTMQTIFAGQSPESLGTAPYLPEIMEAQNVSAESLGLEHIGKGTNVYLFPVISGFLGGDSVAAGLGGNLPHLSEPRLVIDIGTNGELLLGCGERIVGTSCATGPALEGAAISCGMRAVSGAIDRVVVNAEKNSLILHHIGAEEGVLPLGICGSGLIDVMACLREIGVLLPSGRLNEKAPGVICDTRGTGRGYVLVPATRSGSGRDITLSLNDIRAFQLAKSALVVGIEKLLEEYGLAEVQDTCITGAFGAHFDWRNGLQVDLLSSKVVGGQVVSGANLAGAGAMMALLNRGKRREAELLAARCVALELAADPDFNLRFVQRTRFPDIG